MTTTVHIDNIRVYTCTYTCTCTCMWGIFPHTCHCTFRSYYNKYFLIGGDYEHNQHYFTFIGGLLYVFGAWSDNRIAKDQREILDTHLVLCLVPRHIGKMPHQHFSGRAVVGR